jgi:hypothetical protein
MAEQQEVKSKRDLVGSRLKEKYPEKEYADDEALFGQINDDYDDYDKRLKGYQENEKKLTGMFNRYPHSARFISDMANGKNPWVSMVEQLGIDGITDVFENPEYKEELAKAQESYMERMTKNDELEKQYKDNLAQTLKMLSAEQEKRGLSDEQVDQAVDLLMAIANDGIVGKVTAESFDMALKAIGHDVDVEAARSEGEIGGRNAKITEKLRKSKSGDGVPMVAGGNNTPKAQTSSIFDLADEAS